MGALVSGLIEKVAPEESGMDTRLGVDLSGAWEAEYEPDEYDSRVELANCLVAKLMAMGFRQIKIEGTRERVYARECGDNLECRVYTTIDGRQCRAVGKDAIRVCLVYVDGDGSRGCGKDRRVYRVGVIGEIATRMSGRISRISDNLDTCQRCGVPTFKSRRGKMVCAALCWTKTEMPASNRGGLSTAARTALASLVQAVMGHGFRLDQVAGQNVQGDAPLLAFLARSDAGPELAKHGLAGRKRGHVWVTARGVQSYLKAQEAGLLAAA